MQIRQADIYRADMALVDELWIPGRLPNLNDALAAARAWKGRKYGEMKRRVTAEIAAMAISGGLRPRPDGAHVSLVFVESNMRRDPDNVAGMGAKFILDGLKQAGIIPNDGWKHIKSLNLSWSVSKKAPGVWVRLS